MADKLKLWLAALRESTDHSSVEMTAACAHINEIGKNRVIEKHLKRIANREALLSDFSEMILNAPALNDEDE